jgi:hypothetical protein
MHTNHDTHNHTPPRPHDCAPHPKSMLSPINLRACVSLACCKRIIRIGMQHRKIWVNWYQWQGQVALQSAQHMQHTALHWQHTCICQYILVLEVGYVCGEGLGNFMWCGVVGKGDTWEKKEGRCVVYRSHRVTSQHSPQQMRYGGPVVGSVAPTWV